jgi:spore coat protein H
MGGNAGWVRLTKGVGSAKHREYSMKHLLTYARAVVLAVAGPCALAAGPVVFNEVLYHPANDDDRLQYVELYNSGETEADLTGWKLRGAKFDFPKETKLPPRGFLVVARDLRALQGLHGTAFQAVGDLRGKLKRGGEKLELVDANNKVVESFKFSDEAPWPLGPDGYASSLERICPTAPADDPHNWAPSKRASRKGREGTPGRANDNTSAHPLPVIDDVKWEKLLAPGAPLTVSVTMRAGKEVSKPTLIYYTFRGPTRPGQTNELEMQRISGNAQNGRYEAKIPAQTAGTLVRFVLSASSENGARRIFPSQYEPRPALASYVTAPIARAKIPVVTVLNTSRVRGGGNKMEPAREDLPEVGTSAFIYAPPEGEPQLFDFVQVRPRSGGWKVSFLKDQLLEGMSGINLLSEGPPRWMLAEHLSYEVYRRAGLRIQNSGHYRLTVDGRPMGYMLWVEQPNKTFLARSGRNNEGNLYKIRWFERDVVGAHEKKTNRSTGHDDIVSLVQNLNKLSGEAQWRYIQQNFDLTNVISYFAVNMCIQNWDGFFNNYYVYHDTKPGGKWEMIPWDEDKTWGEYDGASHNYDWYEMPLTMGMKGDRAPRNAFGGGPFGGPGWWRPPGWFSGPLLSNVQFRKEFLARLKELCTTVFTEERFAPVIQNVALKLRPEVEAQAAALGQDPQSAVREFDRNIETFRKQLKNRREFILKELQK